MPSSHRPRRAAAPTAPPPSPGTASLRVQQKPERLSALLHAHERLLEKIKLKRRELQRLEERLHTTMSAAESRLHPVIVDIGKLDRELHALFAELLTRKRQPRSTIAAIQGLYRTLQQSGLLSPYSPADHDSADRREDSAPGKPATEGTAPPPSKEDGGVTARRPGEGAAGQSLRSLFRRLAEALHPDKVQLEDEKHRRTEAMKEITRAYQDGDVARLLELERRWLVGSALSPPGDELDRRCAALGQTNEALRVQLDEIIRELKALRRSPQTAFLQDFARTAQRSGKDPIDAMVDGAKEDRDRLRELQALVGDFRDGKIDLKELLRGPRATRRQEPDEFEVFLDELFEQTAEHGKKRGKKRRRATTANHPE